MVDTVLDISVDHKTQERTVCLGHRNAKEETFEMEFEKGRLVRKTDPVPVTEEDKSQMWFDANPEASTKAIMEHFNIKDTAARGMKKRYGRST